MRFWMECCTLHVQKCTNHESMTFGCSTKYRRSHVIAMQLDLCASVNPSTGLSTFSRAYIVVPIYALGRPHSVLGVRGCWHSVWGVSNLFWSSESIALFPLIERSVFGANLSPETELFARTSSALLCSTLEPWNHFYPANINSAGKYFGLLFYYIGVHKLARKNLIVLIQAAVEKEAHTISLYWISLTHSSTLLPHFLL